MAFKSNTYQNKTTQDEYRMTSHGFLCLVTRSTCYDQRDRSSYNPKPNSNPNPKV